MAPLVRVSYVIPPPNLPPPRLALPPLGADRNGSIRPLLVPATRHRSRSATHSELETHPSQPRHRLGVTSLALDASTQLSGNAAPEGILYTGGRDGQVIAWEVGMKLKKRTRSRKEVERGGIRGGGRWESLTGWSDDEEDDVEIEGSDGDVLGEVQGRGRPTGYELPYEEGWELDEGERVTPPAKFRQCMQTHTDWVNDIMLCNLNQTVISASSDGTIRAWSPHLNSAPAPVLVGMHDDYVRCLASSPHQPWIASGSFDRTIKLWDLTRTINIPSTSNILDPTPHSNRPGSSSSRGHSSPTSSPPQPLATLSLTTPSQKASIYAIATDRYGSVIASGSPERVVRLWDPRATKRTGKLVGHTDNIRAVVLSEDGRYLLTGSADASIKLWSLRTHRCLHTFTHHTDSVWALASSHPSLEIFYAGDRAGLVSRVDVEGCATVAEGECVVICDAGAGGGALEGGYEHQAVSKDAYPMITTTDAGAGADIVRMRDAGINQIAAMDDRLLWAATGSSSVMRWKAPARRMVRIPAYSPSSALGSPIHGFGVASSTPLNQTFGTAASSRRSSDAYSPRSPFSSEMHSPTDGFDDSLPIGSPTPLDDTTLLLGLPIRSLVRLDPYTPLGYGTRGTGTGDEVATLYSAASVKSVPVHQHSSLVPAALRQSTMSAHFGALHPDWNGTYPSEPHTSPFPSGSNWGHDSSAPALSHLQAARASYESRDLAAAAIPLETRPDDVIQGERGLVRSMMLNDRMHALTVSTDGYVAVWDVARCRCVGWYDRNDILAEMGANGTDGGTDSDADFQSPRELLETVRERIEGESVIAPWATVDTRIGNLTVHVLERCFETEIYADEAGYGAERHYDTEQRLNVGKWVLSNLFEGFVREELKTLRRLRGLPSNSRSSSSPSNSPETRTRSLSVRSITSTESTTSRSAVSTVITSPSMTPAILPDMTLLTRRKSVSLGAPLIPIAGAKDGPLSPIPQSPSIAITPRPRDLSTLSKSAPSKETDYFSAKPKRLSANATTPDDFSGWGGPGSKESQTNAPLTPSTPSGGGGFMGRLRHFGKSSKRPLSGEMASTPEVQRSGEVSDGDAKDEQTNGSEPDTEQSRFLGSLMAQQFHPPSTTDAPPLTLPLDTEIVLAEETQSGWSNIYRGTMRSTAHDVALLEKVVPIWLMQYLLNNKIPVVPNIKVSFGVALWPGKSSSVDLNDNSSSSTRLTANRYLRVRKILAYVHDKIDKTPSRSTSRAGSISAATPRSSVDAPRRSSGASTQPFGSHHGTQTSLHKSELEGGKKPRPEDVYELLCNDVVLPLNMTLASIRNYIWRSSAELLLLYRRKM